MSIQQVLRKLGQWSLQLQADAPPGVLSTLDYFGHVAVIPGRVNPVERGDECLTLARYVGVLRDLDTQDAPTLSGVGLAAWLGDEDGKGDVIESPGITVTSASFASAINALVPTSIPVGAVYTGVSGTLTNTFTFQSRRTAIDYVCDTMGGEWKISNDGLLYAGPASSLFRTTPTCIIARREVAGYDQNMKAFAGNLQTTRSVKDYTTRVVVVGQGLATGSANVSTVPYKDIHGNTVKFTRIVDETDDTTSSNASSRAQAVLNLFSGARQAVRLSVDDFDVAGDFAAGDVVWVWDPDGGLVDTGYEVPFRGRLLNPVPVRVLSLTWPVAEGHTVAYRSSTGAWVDLTPWVDWETSSGGEVEIANSMSSALTSGIGSIGTTVSGGGGGAGDVAVPGVPTFGTFTSASYQPPDGLARAAVTLTWTQPLNTDASTIVDGDHYDIRFRPTGTSGWDIATVPFSLTQTTITNLPPSTGFDWQIRCVDYASPVNEGAWSGTTTYSTPADTTAPATPAPPTVAASLIAVQVKHTLGQASGGTYNLPLDLDHFEVHGAASSIFTPDTGTLLGKLPANAAMITGSIPAVGTFPTSSTAALYVKVVAVDRTGNRSTASSAASATATLIDSAHISDLTASKITAGSITAAVVIGGSATFSGALSAATGTFAGSLSAATGTFSGSLNGSTVTGGTVRTSTSGQRIEMDATNGGTIWFRDSSSDYAFINGPSSGLGFNSGNGGGSYRTRVFLTPTIGEIMSMVGSTQVQAGGRVVVTQNSVSVNTTSGTAGLYTSNGSALVQGTSGILCNTSSGTATFGAANNNYLQCTGTSSLVNGGGSAWTQWSGSTVEHYAVAHRFSGSNATTSFSPNAFWYRSFNGQLYDTGSTRAIKAMIEYDDPRLSWENFLQLKPVTYFDKMELEEVHAGDSSKCSRQLGLIAEDVAEISGLNALLAEFDQDGNARAVNYDRVAVAMIPLIQDLAMRVGKLEKIDGR